MHIVQRMRSVLDFTARRYVVFVLSYEDAGAFQESIGRATGKPLEPGAQWIFERVQVVAADVPKSYVVEERDMPLIHFL